jgi:hypothetical protein
MVRAAQQRRALWRVVGYVYGARRRNSGDLSPRWRYFVCGIRY